MRLPSPSDQDLRSRCKGLPPTCKSTHLNGLFCIVSINNYECGVCSHASFFLLYLTLPSSSAGPPPLVLLLPPLQLLHEGPPRRPYPGRLPLQPRPLLQLGAGLGGLPVDLLDLPLRCCHPKAEMTFPGSVAKKTI